MRLRAVAFAAVAFAGAGLGAYRLADAAAAWYERDAAAQVGEALAAAGLDWAAVTADGLELTLTGAAPDEASRFRAVEIARRIALIGDTDDSTTIRAAIPLPPPSFALELLRNEADVSLIGLVPETGGRDVIRSALGAGGLSEHVTDMLESADEPAPEGWEAALGYGLALLAELPRAKISVAPGKVRVIAIADSEDDRVALEARLTKAAPPGVALALDISAPRLAITPFAFDFTLADGEGRLEACSAETPAAAAAIVAAARGAGLAEEADCAVGLGTPSPEWADAVAQGLAALHDLGGGRFRIVDTVAELTPPAGVAAERLAEASDRLAAALPDGFELRALPRPAPPAATTAAPPEPAAPAAPRFEAERLVDGTVRLTGPVRTATSRQAIRSYAAALFGHDRVTDATVVDGTLPDGWVGRVLAGIEALADVDAGLLSVTQGQVAIEGWAIEPEVGTRVSALLAQKVGSEAHVRIGYNAVAATAAREAVRPRPEICADQITAILDADSIRFDAGSAAILPVSRGVIAAIADVLRACPGGEFEIGGHTNSEGSPEANRALSEARAEAVLAALRAEDLPMVSLTARGFGADDPVADNATEAGRATNRRIEFTLVAPESIVEEIAPAAAPVADPATQQCSDAIAAILAEEQIQFAAGSSTIAPESEPTIAAIAGALQTCPDARFEIGGHTDSQGSESGNERLSRARAEAVLAALRAQGQPFPGLSAEGYGEAEPVADNATADGRAQNRRIDFVALPASPATPDEDIAGERADEEEAGAACAARIAEILAGGEIEFAAGAATISPESRSVIDAIAGVLGECPDVAIEIGGHTDSMGSESGNQRLSQERADAVLSALRAEDLALPAVTARGYGEGVPVADNATSDGRARNRRIDFTLVTAQGDADTATEAADGPQ